MSIKNKLEQTKKIEKIINDEADIFEILGEKYRALLLRKKSSEYSKLRLLLNRVSGIVSVVFLFWSLLLLYAPILTGNLIFSRDYPNAINTGFILFLIGFFSAGLFVFTRKNK